MKLTITAEELTELIMLLKSAYHVEPSKDETNKFTEAVEKAVKSQVEVVDKPKKKTGPKPKVDRGKVGALHTAGWSVPKIADEMRCSEQTVKNIIKELEATA